MKRHEATIFDFIEDPDDILLMTSHEGLTGGMSIHCTDVNRTGFNMQITKGQARNLISKLHTGIINLEEYEKSQTQEV